jgi:hypothetical protein
MRCPEFLAPTGAKLHSVLPTVLLHELGQLQQRWAWVPLPMVRVLRVAAPAELVGLVTEP